MKKIVSVVLIVFFFTKIQAIPLYNQDGVKLNHTLVKEKTIFVPSLNRKVHIWKSKFELINDSKKSIAVRIPCYLHYVYAYLNPAEISTVQEYVPNLKLSEAYKNYVTQKPQMLNAKKSIVSEKYFATLDNVDLHAATMNYDFKFSFWY